MQYISFGYFFILLLIGYSVFILVIYHRTDRRHQILSLKYEEINELFYNAPLASIAFNNQGEIIAANKSASLLFDATIVQLKSLLIEHLFASTDRDYFLKLRSQSMLNGENSFLTKKTINIVTQRGKEIAAELNVNLLTSDNQPITIITFRNMSEQKRMLKIMSENQLMLNQAQQIANIGSWNWELATDKLIWSDETYRIYGYKPGETEVTNDTLMARIPPHERELVGNAINESVIFNKAYNITHEIIRIDGTTAIVEEQGKVIRDEENKAVRMIGTVRDVTSLKKTEQQLQLSANIFQHTVEAIAVIDVDNYILKTNMAFEKITGFTEQEVLGKKLETILRANYFDQGFYQEIWQQLEFCDNWQGEIWNVRKNGSVYPTKQNISVIKDQQGKVSQYICIFSDVSKSKIIDEQIREKAHFDQLTLLPNRCVFVERLRQTIEFSTTDNQLCAVFSITLSKRSQPNFSQESPEHNQLIASTAKLLSQLIRKQDSVMRSGTNEFNVIIRELSNAEDGYIIAEKILKELTMPLEIANKKIIPGCSIGVALAPLHSENHIELIKYADAAMHAAKQQRASICQIFTSRLLDDYSEKTHQKNELRRAIELKELGLNFEPLINLENSTLSIAKAKILWNHPALGPITFDKFNDLVDDSDLTLGLFEWLLEAACKKATQWSSSTLGKTIIEVEISPSLMVKPGLSTLVNKILTTYQLKPQRLLLEVTEQAILNNPDVTIAELEAIQDLGVGINFDQLGEKYSTIEDIKRIGFNSVNTLSQPIAQQQHSPVIEQKIIALQNKISSLPLREAIVQNHILIGHRVITTVDTNQQTHYLTGRELTQTELLEFSNALNVHNILSQITTIN